MAERYIYKHSWLWHNRLFVRTCLSCLFIFTLFLFGEGMEGIIDEPFTMLTVCGLFTLANISDISAQRKKVKEVVIEGGRLVKITLDNNKQANFDISEVSAKKLIPSKYGFNGHEVEQLFLQVPQKGSFEISSNINSFNRLCKQLLIDDFKALEVHEP